MLVAANTHEQFVGVILPLVGCSGSARPGQQAFETLVSGHGTLFALWARFRENLYGDLAHRRYSVRTLAAGGSLGYRHFPAAVTWEMSV